MVTTDPALTTPPPPHWSEIDWRPFVHDVQIDGRRLRYLDYGNPVAAPLILLHGLGCCWQWWLEVLPALGRHHRVIAIDLPGFGGSERLPEPGEMAAHAGTVSRLCDRLALSGATVAGHSMGGLVTLELACHRPDVIARVIMVNAGGVPMSDQRLRSVVGVIRASRSFLARPAVNRAIALRPRARAILSKVAVGNAGALSGALAAQVVPLMPAPGYVQAVIGAARAVRETEPESVHQPTLLLWGANDPIVTVANARAMERRLPRPELVVIPGTGHSPHVGATEAFITHVLDFTGAR